MTPPLVYFEFRVKVYSSVEGIKLSTHSSFEGNMAGGRLGDESEIVHFLLLCPSYFRAKITCVSSRKEILLRNILFFYIWD